MRTLIGTFWRGAVASTAAVVFLALGQAPASAARGSGILGTHSIVASGNVPLRPGWKVATAFFSIDFTAGPGHKLEFVDVGHDLDFHAVRFTSAAWTKTRVRFTGIGVENGKQVPFVATAVEGATRDSFFIAWNHEARRGGTLETGSVTIGAVTGATTTTTATG